MRKRAWWILLWAACCIGPAHASRPAITHLLNRVTYGPRAVDVERVRKMGMERYVDWQLHPERIEDPALDRRLAEFTVMRLTPLQMAFTYPRFGPNTEAELTRIRGSIPTARQHEMNSLTRGERNWHDIAVQMASQKLVRAVFSERQLQEIMTDFWMNHFNVYLNKGLVDRITLATFERSVIRPRALGRFPDLLLATAYSPTMLYYLDNWLSVGAPAEKGDGNQPDTLVVDGSEAYEVASRVRPLLSENAVVRLASNGQRVEIRDCKRCLDRARVLLKGGLNENYARELMELHTLGLHGGYTQKDVVELARCLTGWTIAWPEQGSDLRFAFDASMHDGGAKRLLGKTIEEGGVREGRRALDLLARHPSTARFISTKLCRRFVCDVPPAALVERVSRVFLRTNGDIREVVRAILLSREFGQYRRAKIKTPLELVASSVRVMAGNTRGGQDLALELGRLGMPLYQCEPPTGFADVASAWINAGTLLERLSFAVALSAGRFEGTTLPAVDAKTLVDRVLDGEASAATRRALAGDPSRALSLILGSPEFQRR